MRSNKLPDRKITFPSNRQHPAHTSSVRADSVCYRYTSSPNFDTEMLHCIAARGIILWYVLLNINAVAGSVSNSSLPRQPPELRPSRDFAQKIDRGISPSLLPAWGSGAEPPTRDISKAVASSAAPAEIMNSRPRNRGGSTRAVPCLVGCACCVSFDRRDIFYLFNQISTW